MKPDPTTGGFIVTHPTVRYAFVIVPDPSRPILGDARTFPKCPTCDTVHLVRTYHILMNGEGRAVVSPTVFQGLKKAGMGGLAVEAHTPDPPKQILGTKGGQMGLVPQRDQLVVHY